MNRHSIAGSLLARMHGRQRRRVLRPAWQLLIDVQRARESHNRMVCNYRQDVPGNGERQTTR